MIFRYMSGTVYQGAWPDPISGEVTRYYGTKRKQILSPKKQPKNYVKSSFTNTKKAFMIDNAAHWH